LYGSTTKASHSLTSQQSSHFVRLSIHGEGKEHRGPVTKVNYFVYVFVEYTDITPLSFSPLSSSRNANNKWQSRLVMASHVMAGHVTSRHGKLRQVTASHGRSRRVTAGHGKPPQSPSCPSTKQTANQPTKQSTNQTANMQQT
jgi:hypothetical protein